MSRFEDKDLFREFVDRRSHTEAAFSFAEHSQRIWHEGGPCGGNASVVGRSLILNGRLFTVIVAATIRGADPSCAVDFDGECAICGRTLKEHSFEGIMACAHRQRDIKLRDVRCPTCNKLVLEHSHSESVACFEKGEQQQMEA